MRSILGGFAGRARPLVCEPLEPRLLLANVPLITEFLAANDTSLNDEDGDDSDWIEIYNPTPEAVNLDGWYLTDNRGDLDKWQFPPTTVAPGEFLVVFASDKNRAAAGGELHTNFKLDADGEYVALVTPDGSIASEIVPGDQDYPPQETDISYGLSMPSKVAALVQRGAIAKYFIPADDQLDGVWMDPEFDDSSWATGPTGIGHTLGFTPTHGEVVATEIPRETITVYIRIPFVVSDPDTLHALTLRMKYDDGFVAYLNDIEVATANAPDELTWQSTATQSQAADRLPAETYPLDSFRSSLRVGENVLAIHGLNRSANSSDTYFLPELTAVDAVLLESGPPGLLAMPTPGSPNGSVVEGFTRAPAFSVDRGFYDEPFELVLSTTSPGAEIRFTTDGSPPTATTGTVYTGPISIDRTTTLRAAAFLADYAPSPVVTSTYLFVDDIVQQDDEGAFAAGFPSMWRDRTAVYGVSSDVIGPNDLYGGDYAASIRDDLRGLPSLSLVMETADMFGPDGIYSNGRQRGSEWERAVSVELIDPANRDDFQVDAALRIHGGASRGGIKRSLRLLFKSEFGPPTFEFPFFGTDAAQEFNTLVLRSEFNDGFLRSEHLAQHARDEFTRRTQLAIGRPSAHGRFVHVYINGLYWGVYNAVERPDAAFVASYYGGRREDWDVIHAGTYGVEARDGNMEAWNTLLSLSREVYDAHTESERTAAYMRVQGLNPDGTDNPAWESYLDVDNYIDYLIVNFYGGNNDWPHRNWYAARRRAADSEGFVFHVWDAEWTLGLHSDVNTNRVGVADGVAEPYGWLRTSREFRIRFADRAQGHFSPGGALYVNPDAPQWDPERPENNIPAARYVEVTDEVRQGLVGESARWGAVATDTPITVNEHWEVARNDLLQNYFPVRSANVLPQLWGLGVSGSIPPPVYSLHGGEVDTDEQLEMTPGSPRDSIYYTVDGSDPRLPGGDINPAAIEYTEPIPLTEDVTVRARAVRIALGTVVRWSAIQQAEFRVVPGQVTLSGDLNGNGRVDHADLDLVLAHWGLNAAERPADWTRDPPSGIIDQRELDKVLLNWGTTGLAVERLASEGAHRDSGADALLASRVPVRWSGGIASEEVGINRLADANPLEEEVLAAVALAGLDG